MTNRYFGGEVPAWSESAQHDAACLLKGVVADYHRHMDRLEFDQARNARENTVTSE